MAPKMRGKSVYQVSWENEFPWLSGISNDAYSAKCLACSHTFSISNGGKHHVVSHSKGLKHIACQKAQVESRGGMQKFLAPSATSSSNASVPPAVVQPVSEQAVTKTSNWLSFTRHNSVVRSELIILLCSIRAQMSARSLDYIVGLFPEAFEDSDIAQSFSLARTKYSYLLCYGIEPFLKSQLLRDIKENAEEYCAMFDESLNKVAQRCQMDIILRYWDKAKNQIINRYLGSTFLGHSRATDLLRAFWDMLEKVGVSKLMAVSMDGPNVNWKFLSELGNKRSEENMPELLSTGCCGLHVVHGAMQLGHRESGWHLEKIFSSAYYLFKDTPVRRSDFIELTSSNVFPLKFCSVRWCENLLVAKRLLDVLPNLAVYCEKVDPKPKVISFDRMVEALQDPLLKAKLGFFISVANIVEPFLRKFQSPKPMVPLLFDELVNVHRSLAQRYLKPSVMDAATNVTRLLQAITNAKEEDMRPIPDIGLQAQLEMDKLKNTKQPRFEQHRLALNHSCRRFLQAMSSKLAERSPLKYPIIRNARALNPGFILESANKCFLAITKTLARHSLFDVNNGDLAIQQFDGLLARNKSFDKAIREFKDTPYREQPRLDDFYWKSVGASEDYPQLWVIIRKVLSLAHGNASVESGFSIQSNQLTDNLMEETMVAKRRVADALKEENQNPSKLVTPEMIKAMQGANSRYRVALEEKQMADRDMNKAVADRKRKAQALLELQEEEARAEAALLAVSKKKKLIAQGIY